MDISEHTTESKLERYAFLWLLALLAISALAMFLGARPPITLIVDSYRSNVWSFLNFAWLISGVATLYLMYQWKQHGQKVFDGTDQKATYAFYFAIATGVNVGLSSVLNTNIFLNMAYGSLPILYLAGAGCAFSAYVLYTAWKANGERLFTEGEHVDAADATKTEPEKTETKNTQDGNNDDVASSVGDSD